ncbi:MAG: hypothetical protein IAE93_05995 [Ignavibacteria bacterium]|nr:hypothetical protein [Ignavibacteria bacterium]
MKTNQDAIGVIHYFYHCIGQELPVRDILNSNGKGHKTEPHYENLTENWFSECHNKRIKLANREMVDYLFLMTRFRNQNSNLNNKLLVVGYLKRAEPSVWIKRSKNIPSGMDPYYPEPKLCGFFVGDEKKSHFVRAKHAYELKDLDNARHRSWIVDKKEAIKILHQLHKFPNILNELRIKVKELSKDTQTRKSNNCHKKTC